jgi:hypothetical protein
MLQSCNKGGIQVMMSKNTVKIIAIAIAAVMVITTLTGAIMLF